MNLILGTIWGNKISIPRLSLFVETCKNISDGNISVILCVFDISEEIIYYLRHNKINIFRADDFIRGVTYNKMNNSKGLYEDTDNFNPEPYRYYIYRHLLDNIKYSIENVIICDVLDVYFQNNPFLNYFENKLNVFEENTILKNCSTNRSWIKRLYSEEMVNENLEKYISCAGVIAGDINSIKKFLEEYYLEIRDIIFYNKSLTRGDDQAILNKFIFTNKLDNIKVNKLYESFVLHLADVHKEDIDYINKPILNKNNAPFSIIHSHLIVKSVLEESLLLNKIRKTEII